MLGAGQPFFRTSCTSYWRSTRLRSNAEREHAGTEWQDGNWMFAQPNGRPIRPEQLLWKDK